MKRPLKTNTIAKQLLREQGKEIQRILKPYSVNV